MAEWQLKEQGKLLREPLVGKLMIKLLYVRKDAARWDTDNRNKLPCDLMEHCGIVKNDNQFWVTNAEKRVGPEQTVIEIFRMEV